MECCPRPGDAAAAPQQAAPLPPQPRPGVRPHAARHRPAPGALSLVNPQHCSPLIGPAAGRLVRGDRRGRAAAPHPRHHAQVNWGVKPPNKLLEDRGYITIIPDP